jgi:uncharacterized protein YcbK (DUF882 family)
MAWVKAPSGLITPHFAWHEASCRHCNRIPSLEEVRKTAEWLERVRTALDGGPMHIHSFVRCPEHNKAIGGEPNSTHLIGWAADFTCRSITVAETHRRLRVLYKQGLVQGLGIYPGRFSHIDRNGRRTWRG